MSTTTSITSVAELPSDGHITIRAWDATRRRAWHVERVEYDNGDFATVTATPTTMAGVPNGEPRKVGLRFGLDEIEVLP